MKIESDFEASFVFSKMNPFQDVQMYDEDVCIFDP